LMTRSKGSDRPETSRFVVIPSANQLRVKAGSAGLKPAIWR